MIQQLISKVTDTDYKLALETSKPKSWLKSVSAFANTVGGSLVYGVTNEDHKVVGVTNAQNDVETITRLIEDRIDPLPDFVIEVFHENDANVVVVTVKPGMATPYYYHADGTREAFIRIGDQSVPVSARILNELTLKSSNRTYDGLATTIDSVDASFTVLRATFKMRTGSDFYESDFGSFGLINADGTLTNAGTLLADEPFVRHSRLFCTQWTGLNKDDAQDDAEFSGSLLLLLREEEGSSNGTTARSGRRVFRVMLWDMNYRKEDATQQVSPQVSPQVEKLLKVLGDEALSSVELQQAMGFSDRSSFQKNYLKPALEEGAIERTTSDSPSTPTRAGSISSFSMAPVLYSNLRSSFLASLPSWFATTISSASAPNAMFAL